MTLARCSYHGRNRENFEISAVEICGNTWGKGMLEIQNLVWPLFGTPSIHDIPRCLSALRY